MKEIKALLFDLGGVIIDIDLEFTFADWAKSANCDVTKIQEAFSQDVFYKAHERGEIEASAYFESLRNSLGINISDQQFKDGWNAILKDELSGIYDVLKKAKQRFPLFAFSNSNHTHQEIWAVKYAKTLSLFTHIFNSSKIGKRKPDAASFLFVANEMGFEPHEILFFDDSLENIIGAQNIGM
jgi:glucose-1-phosphatase